MSRTTETFPVPLITVSGFQFIGIVVVTAVAVFPFSQVLPCSVIQYESKEKIVDNRLTHADIKNKTNSPSVKNSCNDDGNDQ